MVTSPQAVIGHRFLSCMNIVASKVMASLKKIIVNLLIFAFLFLCVFSITKVIGIFKSPQICQFVYSQNGYNVFQDIFSDIEDIRKSIQSTPSIPQNSETMNKVDALQERVAKIAETIMDKPDQVITAKILQNNQGAIEKRVSKLEDDIMAINARFDVFYSILFALVVALAGMKVVGIWRTK